MRRPEGIPSKVTIGGGKADPRILLHPNIPKPLHDIAPRVVLGQEWWDRERRKAYAMAGYRCEACGVPKQDAKYHQWLEAHEYYDYDYRMGRLTLKKLVALCHSCHNFIHSGRLEMLMIEGKITEKMYKEITRHGNALIKKAGLTKEYNARHNINSVATAPWEEWRMVIEGKEYGPSSKDYFAWSQGEWRNWKP